MFICFSPGIVGENQTAYLRSGKQTLVYASESQMDKIASPELMNSGANQVETP
jgi:hypothetical protein